MTKMTDIKVGDSVIALNNGCGCVAAGCRYTIRCHDENECLYINCSVGVHFLDAELNDSGHLADFRYVARPKLVVCN